MIQQTNPLVTDKSSGRKYFKKSSSAYINDVFKTSRRNSATTGATSLKLNQPLREINHVMDKKIFHI